MRKLRLLLAIAGLAAASAFASPTAPVNGVEYTTLAQPQPTQAVGKKVEVIEFFMYHCPHCNVLEPELEAWLKRHADDVTFKRVHFAFTGQNDPEAHLYLTLEAMGKAEEWAPRIFDAIHNKRIRLMRQDVLMDWLPKQGMDMARFNQYWNSFGVLTKMRRIEATAAAYKVDSAPTLIVDGRYMTSPGAMTGGDEQARSHQVTQVLDALVAKAKATKK